MTHDDDSNYEIERSTERSYREASRRALHDYTPTGEPLRGWPPVLDDDRVEPDLGDEEEQP